MAALATKQEAVSDAAAARRGAREKSFGSGSAQSAEGDREEERDNGEEAEQDGKDPEQGEQGGAERDENTDQYDDDGSDGAERDEQDDEDCSDCSDDAERDGRCARGARRDEDTARNAERDAQSDDGAITEERDGADQATPSLRARPGREPNASILTTVRAQQTTSPLDVHLVVEGQATSDAAARIPDYSSLISAMRQQLGSAGDALSDDDLRRACMARIVRPGRGKQRKLPKFATPTSKEIAIWRDGRGLDALMADCLKGVRNDGGVLGPERKLERIALEEGADGVVARAIAARMIEEMRHRIFEIRCNVAATLNEVRREVAVKDGLNPAAIKYFKVLGD